MAGLSFATGGVPSAHADAETLPAVFSCHRAAFVISALALLTSSLGGGGLNPLDAPVLAGLIILVLGVPHGAFDVAIWIGRTGGDGTTGLAAMLVKYIALAGAFFSLWLLAPGLALPLFIGMSIYHFSGDWARDLDLLPRLIVAGAIVSAPAGFHRGEVVEIFSWLAPAAVADTVALVMAAAAVALLQASAVVIALAAFRRPWAAAELTTVLALAWLTPPLMFFLLYFCGLHSVRHIIETRHMLVGVSSTRAFVLSAFPYAPLAIIGTLVGATTLTTLPPGPALISTIFMALGALTVPHIIVIDGHGLSRRPAPMKLTRSASR